MPQWLGKPSRMRFMGRWLFHGAGLALALLMGVLAMQAPAFTHEYESALQQVAAEIRQDVDDRKSAASQYYGIAALPDDEFVAALKAREPSNAETLARSIERARRLNAAHAEITQSAPMFQPIIAFGDAWRDPDGSKAAIWRLALRNYAVQLDFSLAAAAYSFIGLMLGSLVAELCRAALRRGARRTRPAPRTR
jgi:Protein of unknown function (DUF2937)